jgi:glycosyltransferase involved in cell wall biosynthesis
MILSILIPTLTERVFYLDKLLKQLNKQIEFCNAKDNVEILINSDNREKTTGLKRNELLKIAKGEYVWFIDDDDELYPGAINAVLEAAKKKPDCMAINGTMTTNGRNEERWFIAINNSYEKRNGVYYRYPNHITPIKRELATKIKFPNKTLGEDFDYATALKKAKLLKTEEVIKLPIYHYQYRRK